MSVIGANGFGLRGSPAVESGVLIEAIGGVRVLGPRLAAAEAVKSVLDTRRHVRTLVALLASCRAGVTADDLVDALWPEQVRINARNRLHHTMHLARQALNAVAGPGEWIRAEAGRFVFSQEIRTDVSELEDVLMNLEDVSATRLARAMRCCYADWAPDIVPSSMAEKLRRQVRDWQRALLKEFARRALENEDHAEFALALRRCLELDPADEDAYALQMQKELEARRPLAASRVLTAAARSLSVNLGLRPSPVLQMLAARAHVLAATRPLDTLPARPGLLLGRRSLLRSLTEEMVAAPGVWVLHGVAGSGRSALAAELAHRVAPHCPDGAAWLRRAPLGPTLDTALAALSARGTEAFGWLCTYQGLLVIDDFDLDPGAWAWLERLPPTAAGRVVVICLRRPDLSERAGCTWRVTNVPRLAVPLRLPEIDDAQPVFETEDDSWRLFRQLCKAAVPQEPAARQELFSLLQWLDGLPLAIKLAAERCRTLTPGELLRLLRSDQGLLALEHPQEAPAPGADASAQHVLERSLSTAAAILDDEERTVLQVLSTFCGHFTLLDAEDLLRRLDLPRVANHRQIIEALHEIGLVVTDVLSGRIRLLNTQRAWAREDARRVGRWNVLLKVRIELLAERLRRDECSFESNGYAMWIAGIREYIDEARQLLGAARSLGAVWFIALLRPLAHAWSLLPAPEPLSFWADQCLAEPAYGLVPETQLELLTLTACSWLEAGDPVRALHYADQGVACLNMVDYSQSPVAGYLIGMRLHLLRLNGTDADVREFVGQTLQSPWPEGAGFWSLHLWQALSAPPSCGRGLTAGDLAMLRARLLGSRLWGDLMRSALHWMDFHSPREFEVLAEDMRAWARQTGAANFDLRAEHLLTCASLAQDDLESACSRLLKCAKDLASTAPEQAAQAFWWLADIAWRRGALAAAREWNLAASRAAIRPSGSPFELALQLQRVVIELRHGHTEAAEDLFLASGLPGLAVRDLGLLALAVEAAAMVAHSMTQSPLAHSLRLCLGPLTQLDRASPLVRRSREGLGTPSAPERWMVQQLPLEVVKDRARSDIAALVEILRSERGSSASRLTMTART